MQAFVSLGARSARAGLLASISIVAVLSATPVLAQAPAADGAVDEVVVTGSRVLRDGSAAPTPLTVVSTQQLAQTAPSNIPDGLNKLPVFQGSQQPRRPGGGNGNLASNVLALRGFGAQRTLVLLDGHRVAPSNPNGTVSPDVLPQMLVSRVDVVTGGASAVYGSDAVTGVVNFVLDRKFTGLSVNANAGISTYGDGDSYKFAAAYGRPLFDGRGHISASFDHFQQEEVRNIDRPYGDQVWVLTGNGSAANPFRRTRDVRRGDSTFGGKIMSVSNCPTATCTLLGQHFGSNGVLTTFNPGTTTGTGNQNVGGDGGWSIYSTALSKFRTDQAFARFSYDINDKINFYAQGSYAEAQAYGHHFVVKLTPFAQAGTNFATTTNAQASVFFKDNAYLSPAVRAALGNNGAHDNTNVFSLGTYMVNLGPNMFVGAESFNKNVNFNTGFTGDLGGFTWDVYYTRGKNKQRVDALNNSNNAKMFAALDAVVGPTGKIECYAATQAATASKYAGCVPLNAFGPTAITQEMFDYFQGTTSYTVINTLDNLGASIAGEISQGWAGPIRGALSAEARWNGYEVTSTAPPRAVDCTGLRICNPTLLEWVNDVLPEVDRSNNVWEVAGELNVPLLRDLPAITGLTANLAGRYTDYSTSGGVKTWKVGLLWDVTEDLRVRGTTSLDIRAPTLDDLYRPSSSSVVGFVDLHTAISRTTQSITSGNPALVPEEGKTKTLGVVYQPSFVPGLTTSLDYYRIKLQNAIGQISGSSAAVQQLCEEAAGTGPFCSLFERPLPFSNRTAANFPTAFRSQNLNASLAEVQGFDFEATYRHDNLNLRMFANHQPVNKSQQFSAVPVTKVAAPKTRVTLFANYKLGDVQFGVQNTWLSSYHQATGAITPTANNFAEPRIKAYNKVDANLEWSVRGPFTSGAVYFTVQNLFNKQPPIIPSTGSIGLQYPTTQFYDIMGRYFTIGFRAKL